MGGFKTQSSERLAIWPTMAFAQQETWPEEQKVLWVGVVSIYVLGGTDCESKIQTKSVGSRFSEGCGEIFVCFIGFGLTVHYSVY